MRSRHDAVPCALHHEHLGAERTPGHQSNASVRGAMPANVTAAVTRSGSRAAQARAGGPPPE